ncbi:MAG: RagB/SusD family nutrient uptake outer membrane protein [Bacteroidales bacterium]|nr:RagB/SusD family nutrient uptake outer membrane protein [Bacteroidales bacterium]MBR4980123.1 RagB/SusD family nutrient uptake outer membrane protein [Bacteroidales bacterium]
MKKIFSILLVAVLTISLSSCKGFLDKEPTDSVVAENALATLEDAGVAVNGMYTLLKYYTVYGNYMIQMGDMRADLLVPSEGTYITYSYDYDPSQNSYFTLWRNYYSTITRANAIIQNIDKLEVPADKQAIKDDYLGQAYAVRAFCYFDLARLYGRPYRFDNGASLGAVLITTPVSPSEARIPRSTVAETYAQIEADLATALPLLSKAKNLGHFNYWAAEFLKAKVALYKGDNETAYSAAKDVITNSPYSLIPRDNYLASWAQVGNDESIFEGLVNLQSAIDGDNGFGGSFYYSLWFGYTNTGASVVPTKAWRDMFALTPNDIRINWIAYDDPSSGEGKHTGEYWLKKFIGNTGFTAFLNNPRFMRLAEAYFIAAEAGMNSGKGDAANLLLQVAQRADPTVTSIAATMENIEIQRKKELIGEGDRFFDLMRRNGSYVKNDPHNPFNTALTWSDDRVMLPISSDERIIYPELEQNPGYKK